MVTQSEGLREGTVLSLSSELVSQLQGIVERIAQSFQRTRCPEKEANISQESNVLDEAIGNLVKAREVASYMQELLENAVIKKIH